MGEEIIGQLRGKNEQKKYANYFQSRFGRFRKCF